MTTNFKGRQKTMHSSNSSVPLWKSKGFTLMELLLVLVIIGLLSAIVAPSLYQRIKPAKITAAREQMGNFSLALDSFFVDMGRYPTTSEGLSVLRVKPDGGELWKGPYLQKEIPADPWGKNYIYRSPGRNGGYEIVSYGEDSREGGEGDNADINSWESGK
jgi:general secretion pathway protein G